MTGHQDHAFVSQAQFQRGQTRWTDHALCAGDTENIWFPDPPGQGRPRKERDAPVKNRRKDGPGARERYDEQVAFAISICEMCPVKDLCLADAESRNERHGIWGGRDFYQARPSYPRKAA